MIGQIVEEKADTDVVPPTGRMCQLLGVSRAGWYAWQSRKSAGPGPRAVRQADENVNLTWPHRDVTVGPNQTVISRRTCW